jgi:hypothetical protein
LIDDCERRERRGEKGAGDGKERERERERERESEVWIFFYVHSFFKCDCGEERSEKRV